MKRTEAMTVGDIINRLLLMNKKLCTCGPMSWGRG